LVTAICSALGISEHELITASDDVHQRQIEIQAEKYRRLRKRYLKAFNIVYGITLLTCFICNLVIAHALTWFFIAVAACAMMFSLTSLPVFVPKKKGLVTLGAFFLTLNLLLLTCCIYTSGDWFFVSFTALAFAFSVVFAPYVLRNIVLPENLSRHKALLSMSADTLLLFVLMTAASIRENTLSSLFYPNGAMALYLLILPWSFLLVIRYLKISAMFRTSICLVIGGLYIMFLNSVGDFITEQKPFALRPIDLSNWSWYYLNGNSVAVTTIVCLVAALLFAFGGMLSSVRKSSSHTETNQGK
jgi:hypothetical protein